MFQLPFFRSTTSLIILFFLSAISSSHADTFEYSDLQSNQEEHKDEHADSSHNDQEHEDHHDEVEKILIQASRSGRIADEQPIRVELINREEIEEKAAMRPANISMLVAETSRVRMQTTSPELGVANAGIRVKFGH
jgi:outer membrane receptor for ferrienterochelin and colicins